MNKTFNHNPSIPLKLVPAVLAFFNMNYISWQSAGMSSMINMQVCNEAVLFEPTDINCHPASSHETSTSTTREDGFNNTNNTQR